MRIALAQMNSYLGDFSGNVQRIVEMAEEAVEKRADLVVFPELNLLGYHPCDLMERPTVIERQQQAVDELLQRLPKNIHCLVGAATANPEKGKPYLNSALLIHDQKILGTFSKELLPVYDVFDDSRHFSPGQVKDNHFEINGKKIQLLICEDMWGWDPLHESNPILDMTPGSVDFVINMSASPFTLDKREQRLSHAQSTAHHLKAPVVYVNMAGAQDELIYDGGSFAISKTGERLAQSAYFVEDLNIIDYSTGEGGFREVPQDNTTHLYQALVLGIRDFIRKVGFRKAHIGLSGGIDSAVVACLVADAIGPQNLTAIAMPTEFNSEQSTSLAKTLAQNLGCQFHVLPIQDSYQSLVSSYEKCFGKKEFSLVHENFQARLRGVFLMGFSNEHGSLLISTGNKSEYATGFSTLYGDMCGGLAPVGDLLKSQVYELANYYNREHEVIPTEIITRPPSAELKPGQQDSDSLPDYDLLDASVESLVSQKQKANSETDEWVLQKLFRSEFKRWQSPPILKVSDHAFGQGRRMPIAHKALY